MSTIYKNKQAKEELMRLYDEKLERINIPYTKIDIETTFGRTRVIKTGNENGKKVAIFHGYNAGSPLTLEAVKNLLNTYCFYSIDSIGQTTKSAETVLNIKDNSWACWADEVLDQLNLTHVDCIGISYGAFILQNLIKHRPQRINKCILVVPSGIVRGSVWDSITKLTLPLLRFKITKSDKHLKQFTDAFAPPKDEFIFRLLKAILLGVKMDTRIPPLLKKQDVVHFINPVYIMAASNDIYFPSDKMAIRSKELFSQLNAFYTLPNCNHMPGNEHFKTIETKLKLWLE